MFPLRIYVNVMFLNLWPIASNTQDARTLKAAVGKTGKILGSASFQSWQRLPPWVMEEVEVAPTGGAFIVEGEHDRSAVPSSGSDHFWRKGIIYCTWWFHSDSCFWSLVHLNSFDASHVSESMVRRRMDSRSRARQRPRARQSPIRTARTCSWEKNETGCKMMQTCINMCILHTTIFINIHNWIIGYSILHYCWFRVVV